MVSEEPTVEYCVNNVTTGTRRKLLESDVSFHQQHCLRRCGICHERPFVICDGVTYSIENHEQLLADVPGEY